jgi:plasmid stabilization system protein ParE
VANVFLIPAAEYDAQEALDWYAERSARAANGFERALENALNAIGENPELFALIDDRHRLAMLKRYPYSVIYRIVGDGVVVIAVAHGRRSSKFWQDRD